MKLYYREDVGRKDIMLERNPRHQKKDLVSAETIEPGEVIQVYPRRYKDVKAFQGMIVKKIIIEVGRGSKREFSPVFRQVHLTIKPSHGGQNLGIGLGTAVKLIESKDIPQIKTIRFKGDIRITKIRLAELV